MEVRPLESLPYTLRQQIVDGQTRALCPTCAGGSSGEQSLAIYHSDDVEMVKLSCWRSTCDWWALVPLDPNVKIERKKMKEARVFDQETRLLSTEFRDYLVERYQLRPSVIQKRGWLELQHRHRHLVMPVLDHYSRPIGHTVRSFGSPKWCDTYKQCPGDKWFDVWDQPRAEGPIILVEDQLSACKLAGLGYSAIALLGTNLSTAKFGHMRGVIMGRRILLALDNDATDKSLRYASKYAHLARITPVLLEEDIKTMDNEEIHELMHRYGG